MNDISSIRTQFSIYEVNTTQWSDRKVIHYHTTISKQLTILEQWILNKFNYEYFQFLKELFDIEINQIYKEVSESVTVIDRKIEYVRTVEFITVRKDGKLYTLADPIYKITFEDGIEIFNKDLKILNPNINLSEYVKNLYLKSIGITLSEWVKNKNTAKKPPKKVFKYNNCVIRGIYPGSMKNPFKQKVKDWVILNNGIIIGFGDNEKFLIWKEKSAP